MTTFRPDTAAQVRDAVAWAVAEEHPLELVGSGTKRGLGRPVQAAHTLDLSGLSGILTYEPEELLLTVLPGTPMAEIQAALSARGQDFAFEAPDYGPLLGTAPGGGTVGGVVSAGLAGPRRFKAGSARDHLLGLCAVSGRGEAFKAGGKVVKNVTGYDLPKLLTGAFGTLGVLTELTIKVLPAPETARTLVLAGVTAADGVALMALALGSSAEVSGAAWVPETLPFPALPPRTPCALLRLEGPPVSVAARLDHLRTLLDGRAAQAVLEADESAVLWQAIRDVSPFAAEPDRIVWRLSVPPAEAAAVLDRLKSALPGAKAFLDQGGGWIWLSLPDGDARADAVRGAVLPAQGFGGGGHAALVRAPEAIRAAVPVFHPQPPGLAALSARVKAQFDPKGVLNPGRMTAGA